MAVIVPQIHKERPHKHTKYLNITKTTIYTAPNSPGTY